MISIKRITSLLCFSLILLLIEFNDIACKSNEEEITKETKIINDIFNQLADEIIQYPEFPPPPPPPPPPVVPFYKNDTIYSYYQSIIKQYNNLIASIDTNRFVISINDSLIVSSNLKKRLNRLAGAYVETFWDYRKHIKKALSLPIKEINNSGKYELVYLSEITNLLKSKDEPRLKFIYFGSVTFSRVYLNKEETKGFLECIYRFGQDSELDFLLFIKYQGMRWTIDNKVILGES
jgi:hypothetical protein